MCTRIFHTRRPSTSCARIAQARICFSEICGMPLCRSRDKEWTETAVNVKCVLWTLVDNRGQFVDTWRRKYKKERSLRSVVALVHSRSKAGLGHILKN